MKKRVSIKVKTTKLSSAGAIFPLAAAILFIFSPADVHGWDPFGAGKAAKHVHLAISELSATVNKLPEQIKDTIGSNIKLMSDNVNKLLSRIDDQTVPLLNDSIKTQLNHMTDLTNALTAHLNEIAKSRVTQVDQDTAARLNQLQSMIHESLGQVQGMIASDIKLTAHSVVVVEQRTDTLVAKLVSQGLYDAVRYASIFLFMIGLLLLGLRLLRFLEKHISFAHLFSHHLILSLISFAVIATFLGTALYFSLNPATLAGLSARIHHLEKEHPCARLKTQQGHLVEAKEIGDERLINATLERIKESYKECF